MKSFLQPPPAPPTMSPNEHPLQATTPGTMPAIHHAHGGKPNAHAHPHMGFTGPDQPSGNAFDANIHTAEHTTKGKHVIPQGTFGPVSKQKADFPPEGNQGSGSGGSGY